MPTDDLPPLPAEIAALLAVERAVPPPSDAVQSAVWSQVRVEITREGAVARLAKRVGPEVVTVVAFLLGIGAVLVAVRPRSNRNDPRAILRLDEAPEGPVTPGVPSSRERPVPLRPSGLATNSPEAPPAPSSPRLLPPQSFPTLPPPPPRRAPLDAGGLVVDAALVRAQRDTSGEENVLLGIAREALRRREARGAFDAIRLHIARFPDGPLAEEREALAIRALAMSGRADEARARAALFRAAYPESLVPIDDAPR